METLIEEHHRLALRMLERLVFGDQRLDLGCKQPADRGRLPGGQDLDLPNGLTIQTDRYILFHVFTLYHGTPREVKRLPAILALALALDFQCHSQTTARLLSCSTSPPRSPNARLRHELPWKTPNGNHLRDLLRATNRTRCALKCFRGLPFGEKLLDRCVNERALRVADHGLS